MDRLLQRAIHVAERSSRAWVDQIDLLLALFDSPGSAAARALRACGLSPDNLTSDYEKVVETTDSSRSVPSPEPSPRLFETIRRAQHLAASRRGRVRSSDYLIAILLNPGGYVNAILARSPGARECVASALRDAGVDVPPIATDRPRRALGTRVSVRTEDLLRVLRDLRAVLPRESQLAFNHDGKGRAWIVGPKGVDISKYVDEDLLLAEPPTDRRADS